MSPRSRLGLPFAVVVVALAGMVALVGGLLLISAILGR
jgi:hypothetical protein